MEGLLPLRPRPLGGELLSSWVQRLAHANLQRLTYLTRQLTGTSDIWSHDPDRHLRPAFGEALSAATSVPLSLIEGLTLGGYVGRVVPSLPLRAPVRWIMPLNKRGYARVRPGVAYCPACLGSVSPHVPRLWRLSFLTCCREHGVQLRDRCPACEAPFAPLRNDLGRGQDWSLQPELPFSFCPDCGHDLRDAPLEAAEPEALAFQRRLVDAAGCGTMAWPGQGDIPALEGFDVLHQLLAVALLPEVQRHLAINEQLPGPQRRLDRPNRSFEDYDLAGRRALLAQVDWLTQHWPARFESTCRVLGLTRRPLMVNFSTPPPWYDAVAEQFSQASGRRLSRSLPLAGHLPREELDRRALEAPIPSERRRWAILAAYARTPSTRAVSEALGVRADTILRTVRRYNDRGSAGMDDPRRGSVVEKRRLLTLAQEAELREELLRVPISNAQLSAWIARCCGHAPDDTTLWIYRRGVASHSLEGRRAQRGQE